MEKRPFFRAAMTGLGKYHTGGYGRIGVYRECLRIDWRLIYITVLKTVISLELDMHIQYVICKGPSI